VPLRHDERDRLQTALTKVLQADHVVLDEIIDAPVARR